MDGEQCSTISIPQRFLIVVRSGTSTYVSFYYIQVWMFNYFETESKLVCVSRINIGYRSENLAKLFAIFAAFPHRDHRNSDTPLCKWHVLSGRTFGETPYRDFVKM